MSEPDFAPDDPLRALRSQDHRPTTERWRSRIRDWLAQATGGGLPHVRPWVFGVLAVPVVVAIGWQSYVATDPPIESTLPLASDLIDDGAEITTTVAVTTQRADGDAPVAFAEPEAGVVVHVAGAVLHPGLIVGEAGWRVNDAVAAAGGAAFNADLDRINLAAPLVDGERLFIPAVGEDVPEVTGSNLGGTSPETGIVDVNSADQGQLQALPGVGPVTALAIIDHRAAHGSFADIDALVAVRGIGPATVEQLRDHVRAGN